MISKVIVIIRQQNGFLLIKVIFRNFQNFGEKQFINWTVLNGFNMQQNIKYSKKDYNHKGAESLPHTLIF